MPWQCISKMKTSLRFSVQMLFFSLLIYPINVTVLTDDSHYLMYKCPKTNNTYISGSTFQSVLNDSLFSKLPSKASQAAFYSFTNGTDIDQVYALFYCRGDVNASVCHDCILAAADKIIGQCIFLKEAIVWFEECTLRYANRNFFNIDEEDPNYIYTNNSGIMNDYFLDSFKDEFDSAMSSLVKKAAHSRDLQGFATTQVSLSSSEVLHCVVQCTPDIIGVPCERCLKSALNQRDKWADTMIFLPSCFIRVDLHTSTTPPTSTPTVSHGLPTIQIVLIALASAFFIVAVIAVAFAILCVLRCNPDLQGLRTPRKFTYAEIAKATNGFRDELGAGGFGRVYKGVLRDEDNTEVAIKRLKRGVYDHKKDFLSELNTNSSASHRNVVSVVGYCSQGNHKMLVYKFAPNNCLHKHLHGDQAGPGKLVWENRMKIAVGTARGLRYLHDECDPSIIHRDIKSSNILLDSNYVPKVADFGMAKVFPDDDSHVSTEVKGTSGYLDPHYRRSKRLTKKTDVYSFGIVLLELVTGRKPKMLDTVDALLLLLQGQITNLAPDDLEDRVHDCIEDFTSDGSVYSTANGPQNSSPRTLVDPNLEERYDYDEMNCMIICAALCVHPSGEYRLSMSQIVKLLKDRSLQAKDVDHIVKYARSGSEPESSSSNAYPDRLGLAELKQLATRVLTKQPSVTTPPQRTPNRPP